MGDFILGPDANASTLAGGQYQTIPFDLDGEFRDLQIRLTQSGDSEDMEVHGLEIHFTMGGVSKEII